MFANTAGQIYFKNKKENGDSGGDVKVFVLC